MFRRNRAPIVSFTSGLFGANATGFTLLVKGSESRKRAAALAAIGIYGVMAYSVAQRTREIGIRMALGARPSEVMALVLGQSTLITAIGIVAGLAGAAAATRYLQGMLFGLTPLDPTTFVAVSIIFAAVALLAAYLPARAAMKLDPMVALRSE
jgi:putative ABC transport system permease protein